MSIDFSRQRWQRIEESFSLWWAGILKRPLIYVTIRGRDPGRGEPQLPHFPFTAYYSDDIAEEDIVDRWDYELSCKRYFGDSFPHVWPNFGPGVLAAFLGARAELKSDTVWFFPSSDQTVTELSCENFTAHPWFKRIVKLCENALNRWQGMVQIGMTDLGGNLDVVSSFLPGEKLLMELYNFPENVKKLTWDVHHAWWRCFLSINRVLQSRNPGYTLWAPIFSQHPFFILQCDFSYMIGPEMFDEFVKPELIATCARLENTFYHLDGPGALVHLDALLRIEELRGIQWVPGSGNPDCTHWPSVYRKIHESGKLIQISGKLEEFDTVVEQLGTCEGVLYIGEAHASQESAVRELLQKYGVPLD